MKLQWEILVICCPVLVSFFSHFLLQSRLSYLGLFTKYACFRMHYFLWLYLLGAEVLAQFSLQVSYEKLIFCLCIICYAPSISKPTVYLAVFKMVNFVQRTTIWWSNNWLSNFFYDSYAIGGLAGGEDKDSFWRVVAQCTAALPEDKPRYVMVCIISGALITDSFWASRQDRRFCTKQLMLTQKN